MAAKIGIQETRASFENETIAGNHTTNKQIVA
jgi:hypothetical protein